MIKNTKWIYLAVGVSSVLISYNVLGMFIRMKVQGKLKFKKKDI
jgi:hypothetical protein